MLALGTLGWWVCAHGHVFQWGQEAWHAEASQELAGRPPAYCQELDRYGEPCLDSSHLWGPFPSEAAAQAERGVLLASLARLH